MTTLRTDNGIKNLIGLCALLVLLAAPVAAQTTDTTSQDKARSAVPVEPAYDDDFDYGSQSLRVGVWMQGKEDGDVLQKGEKFGVGFQTNQDAYAVVYRIDTEGEVTVLWPRSRFDDGFVFGGHEYQLPVPGKRRLVAGGEAGEGFVEAIVSSYPFDLRELELDFHHEYTDEPYRFQVAGDPFLAMNEVNYVITGMEDSGDYVVTNYIGYYVHHKVDHPRYLCNQCHFEDDVAYHPYNDSCTLEISYDHDWGNSWYDKYGYYPVYYQPVYVYYDPWTWNPWVNWWYYPRYICAPTWGWGWNRHHTYWAWYDSPYYWGDCYDYFDRHHNGPDRRYRPLDRNYAANHVRTKDREYGRVSSLISRKGPEDLQRRAIKDRNRVGGSRPDDLRTSLRDRKPRSTSELRVNTRVGDTGGTRGGLRIRDNTRVRTGDREAVRHVSGGADRPAQMVPARGRDSRSGGSTVIRGPQSLSRGSNTSPSLRRGADKPNSSNSEVRTRTGNTNRGDSSVRKPTRKPTQDPDRSGRTIKPVEPRRKGTRIWNSRSQDSTSGRGERTPSVRSSRSSSSNRKTTVRPNTSTRSSSNSRKAPSVSKPRSGSSSSSGSSTSNPRSTPRVKSSNKSSSSSSGSSNRSSSSRSSGSSRKSGSSSGKSRSGSSSRR